MSIPEFSLTSVAPADIEPALTATWDTLQNPQSHAAGNGKTRACLFNLLFVTKKSTRASYIRGIAQRVIKRFPARILYVIIDREDQPDLFKTSISVISPSPYESDIACDLIAFEVGSKSREQIPFMLLPHLLPDLPVYLLWADDPTEDRSLLCQCETFVDRLIFDSEATCNLSRFASALLQHAAQCDVADLNWARWEHWRHLLFATFQSPKRLEELRHSQSIKIGYNATSTDFFCHVKIQATYLHTWLACQLGWTLHESRMTQEGSQVWYANPKNMPVEIVLIPEKILTLTPGAITSLSIHTYNEADFHFVRSPQSPTQVNLHICSQEVCQAPVHSVFSQDAIGLTLAKEICHRGMSAHFLAVINLIAQHETLNSVEGDHVSHPD